MLFPYSTDAPVYYWPFATVTLIAVNILVFCAMVFGVIPDPERWILWYGDGMRPEQWLTSLFLHGGIDHLLGNMLFLWVFGLVVEGKLGWWKFLCAYLSIGIGQSMFEQMVMLGVSEPTPGSLGASAAIFGLMAMAAVWAPMNEISFFYLFFFRPGTFDVSIAMLAAAYTGFEILMIVLFGSDAGSSWLHLAGFVIGAPLAIVLLKRKLVDCEGWDLFHVWRGDYGAFKNEPAPKEVLAKVDERQKSKNQQLLEGALQQFRLYLKQGNAAAAVKLVEKMKDVEGGLKLEANELIAVVKTLHGAKRWADSAPYMAEFIERFPAQADGIRVKLAQICVVELQRPGKALELLAKVDRSKLPEQTRALVKKIAAKAQAMQMEGTVELDVETW